MSRPAQPAANPKAAHYISNLGAALVRGAWSDPNPGQAPNGSALSWNELIRKWGKHTGGSTGVVGALRNVSLLEQQAAAHVSGPNATLDPGAAHHSRFGRHRHEVPNGSQAAPGIVKPVKGDVDGEDGSGPGAWALNARFGRQLGTDAAREVQDSLRALDNMLASPSLRPSERPSVLLTRAYCLFAAGDYQAALQVYESFDWSAPRNGVVVGDPAIVERIRGRTCEGIIYENGPRPNSARALQCYLAAVELLNDFSMSRLTTPSYLQPPNAVRPPSVPAEASREPLRWASTALARAAVISAHSNDVTLLLRILRTYHALTGNFPSSFRPRQRQGMLNLYLSALYSTYPAPGTTVAEPLLTVGGAQGQTARAMWRAEVAEAFHSGRRLLSDTTHFPKAGKMNIPVIEFADQVAAFPNRTPAVTGEAIAVLWWATTLTFHSQSILRHLTRHLTSIGDNIEARRVFELYVGIVLKARETEDPESPLELKRRPEDMDDIGELAGNSNDVHPANGTNGVLGAEEMDTDEEFVSALIVGVKLLVNVGEASEAWRYAILAGDVAKRGRLSPKAMAGVWASKGIARLAMTESVVDRTRRPKYQAQAINCLRRATELDPSNATAFYHLSYAQASARSIESAIESIQASLHLDSHSVKTWHLLALLLTASGDWQGAAKAAETGVALWEEADEAITAEEADLPSGHGAPPPLAGPFLTPNGDLFLPPPTQPPPLSRSQRLEIVIQLRMTLNIIIEKLQGPDVALARQHELFSFFSQRTETPNGVSRPQSGIISGALSTREVSGRGSTRTTEPIPPPPQISPPSPPMTNQAFPTGPSTPGDSSPSEAEPRALSHKKSLLPKHLHVPSVVRHTRSVSAPSRGSNLDLTRSRAASTSTIALSIAPTAVHSHYHGRSTAPPPPPAPHRAHHTPAEERLLSDLWLQSAATFRRAAKLEQSLVSIEEAETHDPENPAVWVQLGLWHQAARDTGLSPDANAEATAAYTKSLLLKPDYPAGIVCIARVHAIDGELDLAHSLLTQLTQDRGWDVPQAWFALASICTVQGRDERARECLLYALELEKSRTCRPLGEAL